jgi:hypothetical protein
VVSVREGQKGIGRRDYWRGCGKFWGVKDIVSRLTMVIAFWANEHIKTYIRYKTNLDCVIAYQLFCNKVVLKRKPVNTAATKTRPKES